MALSSGGPGKSKQYSSFQVKEAGENEASCQNSDRFVAIQMSHKLKKKQAQWEPQIL